MCLVRKDFSHYYKFVKGAAYKRFKYFILHFT